MRARVVGILALGMVAVLAAPEFATPQAAARSFAIEAMVVEASVRPDGSMEVVERLTYSFDGTFDVGDRDIPDGDYYDIVDMRASEDGRPLRRIDPDPATFEWDLGGATGTHTYDIAYTVVGAVQVGPDVGELYWKFIGDDFPRVGGLDVTITFPGDGTDLLAWAHGPLTGTVQPSGNVVTLDVGDVPAGRFVEARVALPAGAFTVTPRGGPRLATIVAEEDERARRADAERTRKQVAQVASPFVALVGAGAFVGIWRKWGKEPPPPPNVGEYWRDVPEEPPAVVLALEEFGSVDGRAFAATVVDLAQRGWLTIEEQRRDRLLRADALDYLFTPTPKAGADLSGFDAAVYTRLFPAGAPVRQSEVLARAQDDRAGAAAWMSGFKEMVSSDFAARGYVDRSQPTKWLLHGLVVAVVAGSGAVALFGLEAVFGIVGLVVAGLLVALSPLLRKRTPAGARRLAEVEGLRRFLRDFSRLDEVPVEQLALYERYLVYAVALGVADDLVAGLRTRVPAAVDPGSGFATWYAIGAVGGHTGTGDRMDGIASLGSFASDLGTNVATAFSPPSSSGSGGGFSGGGGGGGGGGGAGAH